MKNWIGKANERKLQTNAHTFKTQQSTKEGKQKKLDYTNSYNNKWSSRTKLKQTKIWRKEKVNKLKQISWLKNDQTI
jgi:hypothetical protein